MTAYLCSDCGQVHENSWPPPCQPKTVVLQYGDLADALEFKEAALDWMRAEDELLGAVMALAEARGRGESPDELRARYNAAADAMGPAYDRMLKLARRWEKLENIR